MKVPLYRRGEAVAYALVDDADEALVAGYRWNLSTRGYAQRSTTLGGRNGRGVTYQMHRILMGLEVGDPCQVDHVNMDPLDNRRENLRVVTYAQNKQNLQAYAGASSPHRGVHWDKARGRWFASGKLNGRKVALGRFELEADAAVAAAAWRAEHMPFSAEAAA